MAGRLNSARLSYRVVPTACNGIGVIIIKEIVSKLAMLRDNLYVGIEQNRLLVNLRSYMVRNYFIFYQPIEG